MSVPFAKTRTIDDMPGTDCERMVSTPSTPLSRSASSGTVMNCSTSWADSPSASVWISAYGGVNSGRTSTGALRSCVIPTARTPAARATTSTRKRSDVLLGAAISSSPDVSMIARIIALPRPRSDVAGR